MDVVNIRVAFNNPDDRPDVRPESLFQKYYKLNIKKSIFHITSELFKELVKVKIGHQFPHRTDFLVLIRLILKIMEEDEEDGDGDGKIECTTNAPSLNRVRLSFPIMFTWKRYRMWSSG